MFKRLHSFLRSDSKKIQLKYFFYEKRTDVDKWVGKFMKRMGVYHGTKEGKIDLSGQTGRLYGLHRSGWKYAIRSLSTLHNPHGVLLDAFVDRTFSRRSGNFKGYSVPWVGFIHVPPGVPSWLQSDQTNLAVFQTEAWKRSASFCQGLFTLSNYHRFYLESMVDFPVENLLHPVEFPRLTWNYEKFKANQNKKIVQSGWWLRRVYSIYLLDVKNYRKMVLLKSDAGMEHHLRMELENMGDKSRINQKTLESVTRVNFLSNHRYDQLLSENLVFLDLYDSSANNAIIECIARNTPILVNPLAPVVEYLGKDYPFYFSSLEEAAAKAENIELVKETHQYMVHHPWKYKFTYDYFRESFMNSKVYQSL